MRAAEATSKSNSAIAVQELRERIFSGELAAGSNHLESELAANLGMSRTPIREASLILESQGLIEVRPRKGIRIIPISPQDMREIYDVLTELESLAARQAAKKGLSKQQLSKLSDAVTAMDTAVKEQDLEAWAAADDAFHSELVRLSGSPRIVAIVGLMADQVRRARYVTLHMRDTPHASNTDHRKLLDAIRLGDPDRAHTLHYEHRVRSKNIMLGLLEKFRLQSI